MGKKESIEGFVSYPINRHFVYTEKEVLVPVICVESSLCVNGSCVTNFDLTASFGSHQRLTLGHICDGGDVPFLGTIAAMEIYTGITEGVPGSLKEEIMKTLCGDYKVDIDSRY